jgi:hypothetical protein
VISAIFPLGKYQTIADFFELSKTFIAGTDPKTNGEKPADPGATSSILFLFLLNIESVALSTISWLEIVSSRTSRVVRLSCVRRLHRS